MLSVKDAQELITSQAKSFGCEEVPLNDALNRVLAHDIPADRDYPPFNRSAMDGYAVALSDFNNTKAPVVLKLIDTVLAGEISAKKVVAGTCIKIMTGAPVPEGVEAVVRVEDTEKEGDNVKFNSSEIRKKQNIALQGEDAQKGDLVLRKDTLLDAFSIAALAVVGKAKVPVCNLPKVSIISTGNEVVNVGEAILPHQIRDSNSYSIKSLLKKYAIENATTYLVADDKYALSNKIEESLTNDILILSGGVSKGDADYVPEVLQSLAIKEIFHRVKIKPGAPLWFGVMPNGGVVFGLPGNPVSVQVAFKVFIEPFICKCMGLQPPAPLLLPLLSDKKKKTKLDEYFPCKMVVKNSTTGIIPNKMNGSGDIVATLGSDGIALHPSEMDSVNENTVLEFYQW